MRALGLDLGEKKIGVAVSDATGLITRGAGYIEHRSKERDIISVMELVKRHEVEGIVVGLPLKMDGTQGEKAEEALEFVAALKKKISLPVKTFDERLTTRYSERLLLEADMSRRKRKKRIDALSAEVILQDYLDSFYHLRGVQGFTRRKENDVHQ